MKDSVSGGTIHRGKCALLAAIGIVASTGVAPGEIVIVNQPDPPRAALISVPQPHDTPKTAAEGPSQDLTDSMEFLDRDKFHGTMVSYTADPYGLVWKRSDAKEPIAMATTNLAQVRLAGRKPVSHKDPTVLVRLLNNDTLAGDIVTLDESSLILDTWYSGRLTIKRSAMLQMAMRGATGHAIYEGPNSLNEWVSVQGGGRLRDQWRFENGTLFAVNGSMLSKRFDRLPDLCEFRFSVSWVRYASFNFMFYADMVDQNPNGGYWLTASGSTIYLQAFSRNMGSQQLGTVNYEKFDRGKRSAEFTILANRKTNTFTLLIDGEQVRRWTDARNLGGQGGSSIVIQPQDQNSLRFRNIRVAEWDGKIPDPSAAPVAQKEDVVRLNNSDKLSGKLNAITNGAIQLTTSYATLTVPVQRVEEILFAVSTTNSPAPKDGDVRIAFAETGQITVHVTRIANEQVSCTGSAFGDITLPLPAAKTIDFNLDKKRPSAPDDQSSPDGIDPFSPNVSVEVDE